ncbi:hypothetical protein VZ95_16125 [Elstera litoralis]|uniref:Serine/threonine protein phosphatase n=1 Tax=Elstera litoralis TaxID=552518 RepID=A0A0F3IQ00_9PROT|nr:hypothetical protein [Elstera litoralis]KJV08692.1 hypothetical protein VZ95_16125 [Elstera litoralis]
MVDSERFARLKGQGTLWIVAAIHGDVARLGRLHAALAPQLRVADRLVYTGNFLGLGGDILGTFNELLAFRRWFLGRPSAILDDIAYLRGAQEEMWTKLLQLHFAPNPREVLDWLIAQGAGPTLAAYGGSVADGMAAARAGAVVLARWTASLRAAQSAHPGHSQLMTAIKRAGMTDPKAVLIVHSGLNPEKPLAEQKDAFWWDGKGFNRLIAAERAYDGFARVVRGFDRTTPGLVETPYTLTLDGGCGRGGPLLAVALAPDGQVLGSLSSDA